MLLQQVHFFGKLLLWHTLGRIDEAVQIAFISEFANAQSAPGTFRCNTNRKDHWLFFLILIDVTFMLSLEWKPKGNLI